MSNKFNTREIIDLDSKQSLERVTMKLPQDKAKTAFARDLIVEALKSKKNKAYQHKHINQCLEAVFDEKGERMFTEGNINGAFRYLNKDFTKYNVTKYKENNRVYYKYTTDKAELALNLQSIDLTEQLYQKLNETFEASSKLKSALLTTNTAVDENILELITKIASIELFMLKNQIKS